MKLLRYIDEHELGIASALLASCLLLALIIGLDLNRRKAFDDRVYVIATDHSPPFQVVNPDGTVTGAMVEAIERAAERLDVKLEWRAVKGGPDAYLGVDPSVDLWPFVMHLPEREQRFHMAHSFVSSGYSLISTHPVPDVSAEAMAGKNIAFRDIPYFRNLFAKVYPESQPVPVVEVDSVLLAACRGDVYAAIIEANQLKDFLLRNRESCAAGPLQMTGIPEWRVNLSVGSTFAAAPLADAIRAELGDMARNHELDDLFTRFQPLASLRDADTFLETETERWTSSAILSLGTLGFLCALLGARVVLLRRKTNRALRLADDRYRYLADMSHELRTPLNGILGMASLLGEANLSQTEKEYVSTIQSSGNELLNLINNVLDLAKLEQHEGKAVCESVAPRELCHTLLQMFVPALQSRNVEAVLHVEPDVPQTVKIDASKFRQIFVNLVGNATKFTEKGFVHVHVKYVVFPSADRHLRVEVIDSGPGITKTEQARLFKSFQQTSAGLNSSLKGSGLGLEISRRLAFFTGGRLGFLSEPGKGSTFWYEVPCDTTESADSTESDSSPVPEEGENVPNILGRRVTILGGTERLRLSLENSLIREGCEVRQLQNLLDVFGEQPADIESTDLLAVDFGAIFGRKVETINALRQYRDSRSTSVVVLCNGPADVQRLESWNEPWLRPLLKPARPKDLFRSPEQKWDRIPGLASLVKAVSTPLRGTSYPKVVEQVISDSSLRVLVGEDNPVNRMVIRAIIERLGHHPTVVPDGERLIKELEDGEPYDLILMDCNMPELDGYEATARIRALHPDKAELPIVAVTANSPADVYERCVASGMNDVVGKPVSSELLRDVFSRYARSERPQ